MRNVLMQTTVAVMTAGVLSTCDVTPAWAGQAAPSEDRRAVSSELRGQIGGSINNAGAQLLVEYSRSRPLFASQDALLAGAHISGGAVTAMTPASVRGGAWIEAAPLSIISVRAGVEPAYYFGTFDSLASFSGRFDAFDAATRRDRGGAEPGSARRLYLTPSLRGRAGRFIAVASADFEWWSSTAAGPLFYEPTRDTLLDVSGDRLTVINAAALYEHSEGRPLRTGVMYSRMRVAGGSRNEVERLGVVSTYQAGGRLLSFARPNVTMSAYRYLEDSSKRGQWAASAAIGFSLRQRGRANN